VAFSPTAGVVWKAAVPFGQSSPVVVGSRVYVTASGVAPGEAGSPTAFRSIRDPTDALERSIVGVPPSP
jgi:hypothetical protein